MRKEWTVTLRWAWERPQPPGQFAQVYGNRDDMLSDPDLLASKPEEDQVVDVWVRPPLFDENGDPDWSVVGYLEYLPHTRTPVLHLPAHMGHYR